MKFFQKTSIFISFFSLLTAVVNGQEKYYPPSDSLVIKRLAWWSNIKFGLLMHWGTYSQLGIVESWSLCPEDENWTQRKGPYSENYFDYKRNYENLKTTFNPVKFNPEKWAKAAKDAGMKYVVFTTKHHDGFCMFDTKETDYKITDKNCPFSKNEKSNVTKEVFSAFRKEGLGVGAYFSKPDWHSDDYWWKYFPPMNRNVNYDTKKYPERWKKFEEFTFNQMKELMTDYGKVDILWLDGGWVRPDSTGKEGLWTQQLNMHRIGEMARSLQPGIIMVDRAVEGYYQNYLTPEQQVPEKPLAYPWETCMTMATSWSYVPNDVYKPANKLIHLLAKVVSRGGNFLLNIGPGPDGDWDAVAYSRLKEIGDWMKVNDEAIYETQPVPPYESGKIVFTSKKDGTVYMIYLAEENETILPGEISFSGIAPRANTVVKLLGTNLNFRWKEENGIVKIKIHEKLRTQIPCRHAWVFTFKK
ncbi:MAG: alpha-L-fucosidase [Bacteroidetes bacterium]|nr:alpha-L-fucosidase [Bacteroidota bacterium]